MKYIRVLLMAISIIMIFTSILSVAAESKIDERIDSELLSPRYAIPMSIAIAFGFNNSSDPYMSASLVNISADNDDVDYFILRVVLEKYSSSGYKVIKTWRDVKATMDSYGIASFDRNYKLSEHGSYRIRVSGEGYKGSKCVVTFKDKTSPISSC